VCGKAGENGGQESKTGTNGSALHVGWEFNFLYDFYKLALVIPDSHSFTYIKREMTNPI
jgi:hypothetical protein